MSKNWENSKLNSYSVKIHLKFALLSHNDLNYVKNTNHGDM